MSDDEMIGVIQSLPPGKMAVILIRQLIEVRAELNSIRTMLTEQMASSPNLSHDVVTAAANGVLQNARAYWDAKIDVILLGVDDDM